MKYVYNDFGQLITEYQQHDSAVNTSTSPKVQYQYLTGSNNTIRPTKTIYPNGRELSYNYGTTNSTNDILGRVASLVDDDVSNTHLADYTYIGANTIIETTSPEPDIKYTLIGTTTGNDPDTGDIYRGLDRHSRVKDSYWYNTTTSTDIDRIKYGYDKAGNRTYRENTVASTNSKHYDEHYQYDFVHRLKSLERGNINTTTHSISNPNYEETWSLDETGNWREYQQDTDGDGTWDLIQSRTSNKVNEITDITETVGNSWTTPAYNKSGNMTTIPIPTDPTTSYTATYDAWNRLVKLEDDTNTITEYQYDGTRRRIIHKVYNTGVLDHTKHLYYNTSWQLLEERRDTSTTAKKQYTWGNRYIDDLVLRDHDTNNDGTLNERLYALQDTNWNVTSYVNESGTVLERYIYNAYGHVTFLDNNFGVISNSTIEPDHLYAGYNYDSDVEMYHVRNRVYHPMLGSWLQRDPIGYAAGDVNLLRYITNVPASMIDSDGLLECKCKNKCKNLTDFRGILNTIVNNEMIRCLWRWWRSGGKGKKPVFKQELTRCVRDKLAKDVKVDWVHFVDVGVTKIEERIHKWPSKGSGHLYREPGGYGNYSRFGKVSNADCVKISCRSRQYCIGTDKIGHFFQQGFMGHELTEEGYEKHVHSFFLWTEGFEDWMEAQPGFEDHLTFFSTTGFRFYGFDEPFTEFESRWGGQLRLPEAKWSGIPLGNNRFWKSPANVLNTSSVTVPRSRPDISANHCGTKFYNNLAGGQYFLTSGTSVGFDICDFIDKSWLE